LFGRGTDVAVGRGGMALGLDCLGPWIYGNPTVGEEGHIDGGRKRIRLDKGIGAAATPPHFVVLPSGFPEEIPKFSLREVEI
jgi:hypothetical protein